MGVRIVWSIFFAGLGLCFLNAIEFDKIESLLDNNQQLKQLQYEIDALKSQSKAQAKWDNLNVRIAYSNAELIRPFNISANDMQNVAIGLSQNIDILGRKYTQSRITSMLAEIKILELQNKKNQYILALLQGIIEVIKNKEILRLTNDAIDNIDIVLSGFKKSSNFDLVQVQKLTLLKTRLQIKKNNLQNDLKNAHISISKTRFDNKKVDAYSDDNSGMDNKEYKHILNDLESMLNLEKMIIYATSKIPIIEDILTRNFDIKIANLEQQISLDSIRLAKKSYLSEINLSFDYMYRQNRNDMFALGLSFPLPIFGEQKHSINQAKYTNFAKQSAILEAQNNVRHNAQGIIVNITALCENLTLIDKVLLPANEKIISLYQHHATSQSSTFLEFYNALNEQIDTKILRLELLSNIATNYWNLLALNGSLFHN